MTSFVIQCLSSTMLYACLSTVFFCVTSFGFSPKLPRADGKEQSPTAHRHAAYKVMVLPLVEIYATYLSLSKFDFSLSKAFDHLWNMASDASAARDALLEPLNDNGKYILDMYRVSFFLGMFHYWSLDPFSRDRVWHKVMATILSFTGFYLGDFGGVLDICILLWKPSGAFESIFTLLYLRGVHKTAVGKAYVVFCTAFVWINRWVFENILLYAMLKALVAFPDDLLWDCPQRPVVYICFTALTLLHLKWAYRSAQTLPGYLFGDGAHGLRFTEEGADEKKNQ